MSETYDYEPDPRDFDPEPEWIANGGRWPFPTQLPPNRPIPPMPFNPANHEDAPW